MDLRNSLLKCFCSSRSQTDWDSYKRQRNLVCRKLREGKQNHFHRLVTSGTHSSVLWKALKSACPTPRSESWSAFPCNHLQLATYLKTNKSTGPDGIPAFVLKSSADTISHTVSSIINSSIASSSFPTVWKHAHVKPVHKGGDKSSLSNYWPISLLPV